MYINVPEQWITTIHRPDCDVRMISSLVGVTSVIFPQSPVECKQEMGQNLLRQIPRSPHFLLERMEFEDMRITRGWRGAVA